VFRRSAPKVRLLAGPIIAALAAASLVLARLFTSGNPFDEMWAEDGKIFLAQAGHLSSFAETYAGYAHTLPRVLALLGHQLPVAYWASYAVLASSLVVGALAAFVFAAAREVTRSAAAAVVAAASLALTPALMFETLGSLANLQWFLLPATLWAVLLPAARMSRTAGLVALTAAASTPLAVLLLPAALLVHRRDALRQRSVQGLLVGALIQLALIGFGQSAEGGPDRRPGLPADAGSEFLTHFGGTDVGSPALTWAALGATAFIVAAGVLRGGALRQHVWAAVGSGLLVLSVTTVVSGGMASRYIASASMLLFAGVAITVATFRWALLGVAVLAVVAVAAFPAHLIKFSGPSWSEGVSTWSRACSGGARSASIPVGPAGWGEASIACTQHRGGV
jgi:hypothetical protein